MLVGSEEEYDIPEAAPACTVSQTDDAMIELDIQINAVFQLLFAIRKLSLVVAGELGNGVKEL